MSRLHVWIDRTETAFFVVLYGVMVYRFATSFRTTFNILDALYVFDATILIIFFLMRRKASSLSRRPADYAAAWAGTLLPLLAVPISSTPLVSPLFCVLLVLLGILVHIAAKLSLRRSFGIVAADRGVKSSGLYRLVRHPMYLGYILVQSGVLLAGPVAWNIVLFGLNWMLLLWRIHAEERVLLNNDDYRALCRITRYRLIPGLY